MFDAQYSESATHGLRVVSLSQLARDGSLALGAERTYMHPVLFWISAGQGRLSVDGELRGFNSHNAIFFPANVPHSIEVTPRCHGTAIFFAEKCPLPFPAEELHMRFKGVQAQTEMAAYIEDLRSEASSDLPDSGVALYHRAALTLLWLNRQSHAHQPVARDANASDMLRAIVDPRH